MTAPSASKTTHTTVQRGSRLQPQLWWLLIPAILFFLVFFLVPVMSLFAIAFDKPVAGVVTYQGDFDLGNFERFFSRSSYYMAAVRSVVLASVNGGAKVGQCGGVKPSQLWGCGADMVMAPIGAITMSAAATWIRV